MGTFTPDSGSMGKGGGTFIPDEDASWSETLRAIPGTTLAGLQRVSAGATKLAGDVIGNKSVQDAGGGMLESARINAELALPRDKNPTFAQESVIGGVSSTAQMLPAIALTVASGGAAAPALGYMGATTGLGTYGDVRAAGFSPARALAHGAFEGAVEAATERLPLKYMFGPGGTGIATRLVNAALAEFGGEVAATLLQDLSQKFSTQPDMTIGDAMKDVLATIGATAVSLPLQAGIGAGVNKFAGSRQQSAPPMVTPVNNPAPIVPLYPPQSGVETLEKGVGFDTTNTTPFDGTMAGMPADGVTAEIGGQVGLSEGVQPAGEVFTPPESRASTLSHVAAQGGVVMPGDNLWLNWQNQMKPNPYNQVSTDGTNVSNELAMLKPQMGDVLADPMYGGVKVPDIITKSPDPERMAADALDQATSAVQEGASLLAPGYDAAPVDNKNVLTTVSAMTPEAKAESLYQKSPKTAETPVRIISDGAGTFTLQTAYWNRNLGAEVPVVLGKGLSEAQLVSIIGKDAFDDEMGNLGGEDTATMSQLNYDALSPAFHNIMARINWYDKVREERSSIPYTDKYRLHQDEQMPGLVPSVESTGSIYTRNAKMFGTGESYATAQGTLPQGSVSLVQDSAVSEKQQKLYLRMQKVVQHWVNTFSPSMKVVLHMDNPVKHAHEEGTTELGYMFQDTAGVMHIRIQAEAQNANYVLAHEFGHALIFQEFMSAPVEVQQEMYRDYDNFLSLPQGGKLGDFYTRRNAASSLVDTVNDMQRATPESVNAGVNRQLDADKMGNTDYQLSFDEYMAEQFVAWSEVNTDFAFPTESKAMRSWMRAVVDKVRKFFDSLGFSFKHNESFQKFLTNLVQHHAEPITAQPVAEDAPKPFDLRGSLQKLKRAGFSNDDLRAFHDEIAGWDQAGIQRELESLDVEAATSAQFRSGKRADVEDVVRESLSGWAEGEPDPAVVSMLSGLAMNLPWGNSAGKAVGSKMVADQTRFSWFLGKMATVLQLQKLNGHVPGMNAFVAGLQNMFNTKSKWTSQADETVKMWSGLGKEQSDKLSKVILNEMEQAKWVGAVVQTSSSTRDQQAVLDPVDIQKYGLSKEAADLYTRLHADFQAALNTMEDNAIEELWRIYDNAGYYNLVAQGVKGAGFAFVQPSNPVLAAQIADTQNEHTQLRATPYFPFTRFGKYAVVVKAQAPIVVKGQQYAAGKTVEMAVFDTAGQAKTAKKELEAKYASIPSVAVGGRFLTDEEHGMRGLPPSLIRAMKSRLNLTTQQVADFEDVLKDLSSGQAFIKHMKKREGVAGWSEELQRVYADYMLRFSNHNARLQHGFELDHSLDVMSASGKAIADAGGIAFKRDQLHEWLHRLREYVMKPKSEMEDVRGVLTLAYLGFNLKSALINGFQVPMVSLPYLSARSSVASATAHITKAYRDIFASWKTPARLNQQEWAFLQKGIEDGWINESFAAELANAAEGNNIVRALPVSRLGKGWAYTKTKGMWLFQRMEEINRRVTAIAAYRLAIEQGNSNTAAYDFARSTIQDTQGEYAKWNRPEFMRGPLKATMFMFMQYQQNMVFQMYGGDKSWLRLLAMHLALAGLLGLPFVGNVKDLIVLLTKTWGLRWDPEMDAREFLVELGMNPDWVLKGLAHNLGGVDLSGSVGMGRIIPGTEQLAAEGKFADKFLQGSSDVGGAGFSFAVGIMQAVADDNPNTLMRFQRAMPTFFQNIAKAVGQEDAGGVRDRSGTLIAETNSAQNLGQALGFRSTSVAAEQAEWHEKQQLAKYWSTRRQVLLDQYYYTSQVAKDREGVADVKSAIEAYNSTAPVKELKIDSAVLQRSIQSHLRAKLGREKGVGTQRTTQGLMRAVEGMYTDDE